MPFVVQQSPITSITNCGKKKLSAEFRRNADLPLLQPSKTHIKKVWLTRFIFILNKGFLSAWRLAALFVNPFGRLCRNGCIIKRFLPFIRWVRGISLLTLAHILRLNLLSVLETETVRNSCRCFRETMSKICAVMDIIFCIDCTMLIWNQQNPPNICRQIYVKWNICKYGTVCSSYDCYVAPTVSTNQERNCSDAPQNL